VYSASHCPFAEKAICHKLFNSGIICALKLLLMKNIIIKAANDKDTHLSILYSLFRIKEHCT